MSVHYDVMTLGENGNFECVFFLCVFIEQEDLAIYFLGKGTYMFKCHLIALTG